MIKKMTVTSVNSGCYWTFTITNAAEHIDVFSRWHTFKNDDGSVVIVQVKNGERPGLLSLIESLNNPVRTKKMDGSRYIELLSIAQAKNLSHGKPWYCNDYDISVRGMHPMHEGELICYVYK